MKTRRIFTIFITLIAIALMATTVCAAASPYRTGSLGAKDPPSTGKGPSPEVGLWRGEMLAQHALARHGEDASTSTIIPVPTSVYGPTLLVHLSATSPNVTAFFREQATSRRIPAGREP